MDHAGRTTEGRIVLGRWSMGKRVYASALVDGVLVAVAAVAGLERGRVWEVVAPAFGVWIVVIGVAAVVSVETWLCLPERLVVRGVRVGPWRVAVSKAEMVGEGDPVCLRWFRKVPRGAPEGWCLGVRCATGRIVWIGYSFREGELARRANEIRRVLRAERARTPAGGRGAPRSDRGRSDGVTAAPLEKVEARMQLVLDGLVGRLPEDQMGDLRELVGAGEWGVAFENLCTQLSEYDVGVSPDLLAELGDSLR